MSHFELLRKRKRSDDVSDFASVDSDRPYGIPIYSLLKDLERTKKPPKVSQLSQSSQSSQSKRHKKSSILLSEKYRASTFFELVGNDDANRQVLRWLSYWKSCVFGTEPTLNDYTDAIGRPLRKILLINGPPGAGKTTAAHVIARQAGFDTLEINASDDRGAAVVKGTIQNALNSHQVNSKRPICIVADEVEGASEHGFVKSLLQIINEDTKALAQRGQKSDKKKAKNQPKLLLRPIVAICNNVWASSLRVLRQHAEIIHYRRHESGRLVKRLEQICSAEKMRVNSRQLIELAEANDLDLRSCLNALQFESQLYAPNSLSNSNQSASQSSEKTDWAVLVRRQFLSASPASFSELESCSQPDKLINSCFTVYNQQAYIDDVLKKPAELGDFLCLADHRNASDEMKAFVTHAFGYMFRTPGQAARRQEGLFGKPPSIFEQVKQTKSLADSVMKAATGAHRFGEFTVLTELMPFVVSISSPETRPLLRPEDKERIHLAARAMYELGVNIKTDRVENGTFVHRLEPPIEKACVFGPEAQSEASGGNYVARSLVKNAIADLKAEAKAKASPVVKSLSPTKTKEPIMKDKSTLKEKVSDFFSTVISTKQTDTSPKKDSGSKIWVQYSEGFSNAVRKPITWTELFEI